MLPGLALGFGLILPGHLPLEIFPIAQAHAEHFGI
jgi:hypothetical protein